MRSVVDTYSINKARTGLPELKPGQTVKVYQKVKEGNKERVQIFEGLIIAMRRKQGTSANIVVRKESYGVGVERIFPLSSPLIDKIEVVKQSKVRRAKLFYMRKRTGKAARMKNTEAISVNNIEEIKEETAVSAEEIKENEEIRNQKSETCPQC